MDILRLISCFSTLFFHVTCQTDVKLTNKSTYCVIPYMSEICSGPSRNRFTCWRNFISQAIHTNCSNSQTRLTLTSNNLLFLYPPFFPLFLNYSQLFDSLTFQIVFYDPQSLYDIDLRSLNHIGMPLNVTLITRIRRDRIEILFRTFSWNKRAFFAIRDEYYPGFLSTWQILPQNNSDQIVCYHFNTTITYSNDQFYQINYTCPSDQCSISNQRICLGLTSCLNMGDDILLCQIDRLRSNDQFNSKSQFLYTDLIITTSDTDKQTLHRLSTQLWYSCIAVRLIVVILHGQLEIPSLNFTSANCSSGLVC